MASNAIIRIGNYKLGKTLGIGSFGKVKMAEHEITGHKVAVKIMNRKKIKSLDMDEKVRREIKILKLFMHPHIIRLYEVIDTPTHIFVVMEYVAGGELFDYIVQKGRLSEDEARRFFQQIISGVEYCHRHNVVHRDLKPENLLLDSQLNVKIADFGLSNMMRDGFFLKTSCGSPNYAAPEVISGKLYAGPEVDVWSCGVILYALLCGSLPFDDENIPNLFKKIKGGIYTLPSHLSDLARDLIPKMLIVDAVKRITVSEIRQHPWFQIRLPAYLAITPEQRMAQVHAIDEDVMSQVVQKLNFPPEQVVEAVRTGDRNQITVAYYLMLEHSKRLKEAEAGRSSLLDDGMEVEPTGPSPWPTMSDDITGTNGMLAAGNHVPNAGGPYDPRNPRGAGHDIEMVDTDQEMVALFGAHCHVEVIDSIGLPSGFGAFPSLMGRERTAPTLKDPAIPPRKWYLGIQTRNPPAAVMQDLYRALKAIGFEWKIINAYNVKCRRMDGDRKALKMNVQLYKVHDTRYLLDIQKLYGGTFPFLDTCAKLIHELRI